MRDRQVDVRLMAATHQDLGRLVQEQKFREDLYYRISTLPLVMPPLRERGRDVVLLARRLMERIGAELGRPGVRLSPSAEHGACRAPLAGQRARAAQRAGARGPAERQHDAGGVAAGRDRRRASPSPGRRRRAGA